MYPGVTILTYFIIMLFLCAMLSVSAPEHICTYCKNRLQQYPETKYQLCTYNTVAINILCDLKIP